MQRFIDPNARPAMSGRYRQGQTPETRTTLPNPAVWAEQELTPEQKAALESYNKSCPHSYIKHEAGKVRCLCCCGDISELEPARRFQGWRVP
jgi:hypothetical protein